METDRLRYFCAIVDTGSLTKAGELLNVSHSGLSKAMVVLQNEIGYKIFLPKGRGLELTEKGRDLYEKSRKILEMVNSLKHLEVKKELPIRLVLPEALALASAEALVREMEGALTIEEMDSGEIEARILSRRADFGFTFVPFPHKEIDHLKIATIALSSFCLAGRFRGVDPEQIPYVVPSSEMQDNPLSLRIRDGWNSQLSRQTPYRANSVSIGLKMVQAGCCAIYIPEFTAAFFNETVTKDRKLGHLDIQTSRRNNERTFRDVFLVKRASDEEVRSMKTATRVVRQMCKAQVAR